MTDAPDRTRLLALDRCLHLIEEALVGGRARVDAQLGSKLRCLLAEAGLIPDHRLEGRRTDRVLDDIFALQARVLGTSEEEQSA